MKLFRRFHYMFIQQHSYVKPINSSLFGETYIHVRKALIAEFFDDRQRYGVRVAVQNLCEMLPHLWKKGAQ